MFTNVTDDLYMIVCTMSSKELKSRLKAAKTAIDEKDFEKALKQCQMLFQLDGLNYNGHVFAGLACLQLGRYEESKTHYKNAIAEQPDGPLAWKGLADYYDKHKAVTQEEQQDAIQTYTKLLGFIGSNAVKKRSTLQKLIILHKEFDHDAEVLHCYKELVDSIVSSGEEKEMVTPHEDDSAAIDQAWIEVTSYLLGRKELSDEAWALLEKTFQNVAESCERKSLFREKFTRKSYSKLMLSECLDLNLKQLLEKECCALVVTHPNVALPILVRIGLMDIVKCLCEDWERSPLTISDTHKEQFRQYHSLIEELGGETKVTGTSSCDVSLAWAGLAAVHVCEGNWKEARNSVMNAVEESDTPSECWLLASYIYYRLYDYNASKLASRKGIMVVSKSARYMKTELESCLKFMWCKACLGAKEKDCLQEAIDILSELGQDESRDCHVTICLFKAYLLQDDIETALKVLQKITDKLGSDHYQVFMLQAEFQLAKEDFPGALSCIDTALSMEPGSFQCLLLKGNILWKSHDPNKKPAYAALLQAAKADQYNPDVFLLLGHYQRYSSKDLRRAAKCYQKALDLQPMNIEAAMSLGDVLTEDGNDDEAFEVYSKVVSSALISKSKLAWFRMGLYQQKKQRYTEAIHSFQNVLATDPTNQRCWECLGEAYFARGSHNSALRTFTKVLELDPDSLYSLYQIASIKKLLGVLQEAVSEYSIVLEKDPTYVPALKGICACQ